MFKLICNDVLLV